MSELYSGTPHDILSIDEEYKAMPKAFSRLNANQAVNPSRIVPTWKTGQGDADPPQKDWIFRYDQPYYGSSPFLNPWPIKDIELDFSVCRLVGGVYSQQEMVVTASVSGVKFDDPWGTIYRRAGPNTFVFWTDMRDSPRHIANLSQTNTGP